LQVLERSGFGLGQATQGGPCTHAGAQVLEGQELVARLQFLPVDFFSRPKERLKVAACGVLQAAMASA